ncbi:DUF1266 domain-containing protein, partial [Salmonella enterica subsp. enterica serovar Cerro]|nr:DUF1266 domain-containing protein [Salmonella enterica subsp. enterica serovar Cerro]
MGFLCRMGVLNEWLTEEESLWLQSRIQLRALSYYSGWLPYFSEQLREDAHWHNRDHILRVVSEGGSWCFVSSVATQTSCTPSSPF